MATDEKLLQLGSMVAAADQMPSQSSLRNSPSLRDSRSRRAPFGLTLNTKALCESS